MPNGSWRQLVTGAIGEDIQARRAGSLASSLPIALKELDKQAESKRAEARVGRTAARTAVYSRYPDVAAQELGMEIPEGAGGAEAPEGMRGTKVVYDAQGRPVRTYEAPEALAATVSKQQ